MNCNVVKDLIPLYIDKCCSDESAQEVEKHLCECNECKAVFESMNASIINEQAHNEPLKATRINDWKASVMQSVLLFASFLIITIGVALEASTPSGFSNGLWAFNLVIPATGFMLSLANWYFIRLYKSRKAFSKYSCVFTFLITACAYVWAGFHYEFSIGDFIEIILDIGITDFFEMQPVLLFRYGIGIVLTAVFCSVSKVLSNIYAKMLGKE